MCEPVGSGRLGKFGDSFFLGLFVGPTGMGWGGMGWQYDEESVLKRIEAAAEERVRQGQLSAAEGAEVAAKARQSLQSYTYLG